jgi:hypothetical protein
MTRQELAEARDTYLWHINECKRMFWVINPRSSTGLKITQACEDLTQALEEFMALESK